MKAGFILDGNFARDPRVSNEARILADNGHIVFVLNRVEEGRGFQSEPGINIISRGFMVPKKLAGWIFAFENFIPVYDLLWALRIRKFISENGIEVVHAHDLYMARPAHMAVKGTGIPLIIDLHENYPAAVKEYRWANRFPARIFVRPGRWLKKERKYLSFADRIIVLSPVFRDRLISKYPEIRPEKFVIYPNVPEVDKLLSYGIKDYVFAQKGERVIFYFGVISRRRGIQTAIDALESVLKKDKAVRLLLIGPVDKAEKNDFMKLFNKDDLIGHITHYPWKDISEFPSFVNSSAICISPLLKNDQHESGIANKVYQYMLFGKPVLVSDCAPQVELVMKTGCGIVFRSGDATDMSGKILDMLSDPSGCRMMGENGRQAVLKEYNTVVQGATLLNAYSSIKDIKN